MLNPIGYLSAAEISAVLNVAGEQLTAEQSLAIQDFIDEIGGIENARAAVELLSELEGAA